MTTNLKKSVITKKYYIFNEDKFNRNMDVYSWFITGIIIMKMGEENKKGNSCSQDIG